MANLFDHNALVEAALGRYVGLSVQAAQQISDMPNSEQQFESLTKVIKALNWIAAEIAVRKLEEYGELAIEPLTALLPDCDPMVQVSVVRALARIGDLRAVPVFREVLAQTEFAMLRFMIIEALGEFGDTASIELIQSFADDPDRHVRKRVTNALSNLQIARSIAPD